MPLLLSRKFESPMVFDVRMTDYARHRLNETIDYIQYVCNNGPYAATLLSAVSGALEKLKTQEHFRIVDHAASELVGETVYRVQIGKYRLIYRVKPEENQILVFAFMHESRPLDDDAIVSYRNAS